MNAFISILHVISKLSLLFIDYFFRSEISYQIADIPVINY